MDFYDNIWKCKTCDVNKVMIPVDNVVCQNRTTVKNSSLLKESSPIYSTCFQIDGDFGITGKLVFFSVITHGKFHSWKAFRLEDINGNVPGYGKQFF